MAVTPRQGVELAVRLGRSAFLAAPQAEGLLLAGGAWLSLQAVPILEAEFGRPVVTNPSATFWAALRQFGIHSPSVGWGRLHFSLQAQRALAVKYHLTIPGSGRRGRDLILSETLYIACADDVNARLVLADLLHSLPATAPS